MTNPTPPDDAPEPVPGPLGGLSADDHAFAALDALTRGIEAVPEGVNPSPQVWAMIGIGQAALAVAAQLARVAEWLEGVELIAPHDEADAPADEAAVDALMSMVRCEWCNANARGLALRASARFTGGTWRPSCGHRGHGYDFRPYEDESE